MERHRTSLAIILLAASTAWAANPSFDSFDTDYFTTLSRIIKINTNSAAWTEAVRVAGAVPAGSLTNFDTRSWTNLSHIAVQDPNSIAPVNSARLEWGGLTLTDDQGNYGTLSYDMAADSGFSFNNASVTAGAFYGSGSGLTGIPAAAITYPPWLSSLQFIIVNGITNKGSYYGTDGNISIGGSVSAASGFYKAGVETLYGNSSLNAGNLLSGTVPNARLAGSGAVTNGNVGAVTNLVAYNSPATHYLTNNSYGFGVDTAADANSVLRVGSGFFANVYRSGGNYFGANSGALRNNPGAKWQILPNSGTSLGLQIGGTGDAAGAPMFTNVGGNLLLIDSGGAANATNSLTIAGTLTASNGLVLPSSTAYIQWTGLSASNPPTAGASSAFIFASTNGVTAEICTMDGAGNITLISPHAVAEAPPEILDPDDPFPNVTKEMNPYLGKVRWINHSRAPKQQELLTKVALNSMANWQFLTGKTSTQWSNAAAFGKYTNALMKLDELAESSRQLVFNETFEEFNARLGLTNGTGLTQMTWAGVQERLSNEVWSAWVAATNAYAAAVASGDTNAVAPGNYVPRTQEPVPGWLYNRGVR